MCELQLLVVTDFGVSRKHKGVMKMNKYQEALDRLISNIGVARCNYRKSGEAKENVRTLQELIDKATPKKPHWIYDDEPLCPYCGEVLDGTEEHCDECDQRLDWSE